LLVAVNPRMRLGLVGGSFVYAVSEISLVPPLTLWAKLCHLGNIRIG
jgi:hypothetical protein